MGSSTQLIYNLHKLHRLNLVSDFYKYCLLFPLNSSVFSACTLSQGSSIPAPSQNLQKTCKGTEMRRTENGADSRKNAPHLHAHVRTHINTSTHSHMHALTHMHSHTCTHPRRSECFHLQNGLLTHLVTPGGQVLWEL